jgi:hypothetical protein
LLLQSFDFLMAALLEKPATKGPSDVAAGDGGSSDGVLRVQHVDTNRDLLTCK